MSLKQQIDADVKQAMLAGDKTLTTTLRGLKGAILNVEVNEGKRDAGLGDDEIIAVMQKEAKKRQESADMFTRGGNDAKAQEELTEKAVIEKYLPAQLSDAELTAVIDKAISDTGAVGMQSMGQVIGKVKQEVGAQADGATIARLVKERLK